MDTKPRIGLMVMVSVIVTFFGCLVMAFLIPSKGSNVQTPFVQTTISSLQDQVFSALGAISESIVSVSVSKDIKLYADDPSRVTAPGAVQTTGVSLGEASGILIRKDGYVLTNKHVVQDPQAKYQVTLRDGRVYIVSHIRNDPIFDLAVLKITDTGGVAPDGLPVARFASFDKIIPAGTFVLSIGNMLNQYPNAVSFGIVAGNNKTFTIDGTHTYVGLYQTDAKATAGSSGGPLLSLSGEIIGMVTAISDSQGLTFALPIPTEFISSLLASIDTSNSILRPLIGVEYVDITPDIQRTKKLSVGNGILITSVMDGLPAKTAGIQEGDIIVSINDKSITSQRPFLYHIYMYVPGTTVHLTVIRNGQTLSLPVELGQNSQ